MAVLVWLGVIFFGFSYCSENLARRETTIITQSSTYNNNFANLTNDDVKLQDEAHCAHTGVNKSGKAWLEVDLGQEYSIKSVKIYYRDEDSWKPYRFRQFYLDVSNSSATTTETRIRCYTDNTTNTSTPSIPPNKLSMPCNQIARYVIVETMYDAPDDSPTTGPILEICEIEVNGCSVYCNHGECRENGSCTNGCKSGYWGPSCESPCNSGCSNRICDSADGRCTQGCDLGFWGRTCDSPCPVNCHKKTCDQYTAHCNSCKPSYWGDKCTARCSAHCSGEVCDRNNGRCTQNCTEGFYGDKCDKNCSHNCVAKKCDRHSGACFIGCAGNWKGDRCEECSSLCKEKACDTNGFCTEGCHNGSSWGRRCESPCSSGCSNRICDSADGRCTQGCDLGFWRDKCTARCSAHCSGEVCDRNNGSCTQNCTEGFYDDKCDKNCSHNCVAKKCDRQSGACIGGCARNWEGDQCEDPQELSRSEDNFPTTEVGAGVGAFLFMMVVIIAIVVLLRTRRDKESNPASSALYHKTGFDSGESKGYTNLGSITVAIEDPDEEPQREKPEECVYYNNLSVAKDIAVSDLLNIITSKQAKEKEGFQKEFKSLPYGERFPCEVAKSAENMPKNRFKTTFPYDHSRVVLESSKEFNSDYINANYIENMDGKREFIASQGPRVNTVVDHWRMIWQEHVNYIVMLTNLIEGPKVKCHQYWPEAGKEMDVDPFSLTLLEEKVYAYFVVRKMAVRKKKVTGSRTVVQFHYTHWPDHGTPDPLNLVDFLRQFRHKIKPSHQPILIHCSAGIGRTGTFIALDVLSRYGKVKGKVNIIEYVKAMRKDRMTMIQNVDQYVFLYHALYEFFRRSGQFVRKDDFLSEFANLNKAETKKQLSDEFNELTSLKPKYEAKDYKSGKKHQKLNASKSVLPVEKYLVYLTSHIAGRDTYYNAINVSSFTQAEELISAQLPVAGAAIDLVRLLIDEDCSFLVSLNPMSEVKELKDWVNDNIKTIKLDPYEITKHAQTEQSPDIRKTNLKIKGKEDDILGVEILECMSWSSSQTVPTDKSILINFIKQFCLDRRSHPDGRVAVLSKDGAVGCGVFCAVYNAVQQIQQDAEVDMFTIVRQLQVRRPEMISTVEEYELCYDAVHQFLASDSVYANT